MTGELRKTSNDRAVRATASARTAGLRRTSKDIPARATVGTILIIGVRIGLIIQLAIRILVVVRVDEIVAPASIAVIPASAANQPVISEIPEEHISAVVMHRSIGAGFLARGLRNRAAVSEDPFIFIEIQQEFEVINPGGSASPFVEVTRGG